jgi:hypothetical protein
MKTKTKSVVTLRVTEEELCRRQMEPYYRGNVVSALGDLLSEKAGMGIKIGLTSTSFVSELERIRDFLGAEYYTGRIDDETMERIYSFYPPKTTEESRGTSPDTFDAAMACERLRDCDWVISLPDRMDAVRDIARAALAATAAAPPPTAPSPTETRPN